MKRLLVRFCVLVGLLAAPLAMATAGTAGAQDVVPGVVDVGVSISVPTPQVSPPGTLAMYDVAVSEGAVPVPYTVTVHLPPGSDSDEGLTDGGCSAGAETLTCTGASAHTFEILATTPGAGSYTVSAEVVATGDLAGLEYDRDIQGNNVNTASAPIVVKPAPQGVASGVVKRGHSISLDLGNGRTYNLAVPTTSDNPGDKGVIVTIKGEPQGQHTCVGGTCGGDGFNVSFDNTVVGYQWTDYKHPLVSTSSYGTSPPCRGIGNPCWELGYSDSTLPAAPVTQQPWCGGASDTKRGDNQALPTSLCTNDKYKVNGVITFETLLTSTDPIQLPISKVGL